MTTNITATQIRRQFAEIAKKVEAGESHLVTRHNKVIFAIISGADYDKFQTLLQMQESLEDFIKKSNTVPVKQLIVTLPPTMYKVEAVAEPVDNTPKVECLSCGQKVAEGTHGTCPKNELEMPKVTAEEKGLPMTAAEAVAVEKESEDLLKQQIKEHPETVTVVTIGNFANDGTTVTLDQDANIREQEVTAGASKGLFTGD